MSEKIDQEGKFEGEAPLEKPIKDVGLDEIEKWKELRDKIDKRKTLEIIARINKVNYETNKDNLLVMEESTGEFEAWDGNLSFWGIKRIIMMLFDPKRESSQIFRFLSPEAQEIITELNIEELKKKD